MSLQASLSDAIQKGDEEGVRHLFEQGAPMTVELFASGARNKSLKILDSFIEHGWDINTPQGPFTPSPVIEVFDDMQILGWFLNHGLNANKQCEKRNITPLSCAVRSASMSVVQLLFDNGGDINSGQLLHYAALRHGLEEVNSEVLRYIYQKDPSSKEKLNKILDEDDEENYAIYNKSGLGTPLHFAASVGSADSVKFLLEEGADPTIKDPFGMTPLEIATNYGYGDISGLLKSYERAPSCLVS